MFLTRRIKKILKDKSGEEALMAIENLLTPIFYSHPNKLTEEEKTIVYIEELEREVNNGGFSQFFFNISGNFTEEIINALKIIGSTTFTEIVEKAIAQFPNSHVLKNRNERQKILERI